jgi:hypothetical protein
MLLSGIAWQGHDRVTRIKPDLVGLCMPADQSTGCLPKALVEYAKTVSSVKKTGFGLYHYCCSPLLLIIMMCKLAKLRV